MAVASFGHRLASRAQIPRLLRVIIIWLRMPVARECSISNYSDGFFEVLNEGGVVFCVIRCCQATLNVCHQPVQPRSRRFVAGLETFDLGSQIF